jgi:hypothetical protein
MVRKTVRLGVHILATKALNTLLFGAFCLASTGTFQMILKASLIYD